MDGFMEKLTGRFGSNEAIKANHEAEAKQLEAYKSRVEELEKAVSDMRRLSLKCAETNEATGQLVAGAIEKIEEVKSDKSGNSVEELESILERLNELKTSIDDSFKGAQEESHKENVRVYRNVQAAVIEELKQQSEAIAIQHMHIEKKIKGVKPCAIIALVFSGLSLTLMIAGAIFVVMTLGL